MTAYSLRRGRTHKKQVVSVFICCVKQKAAWALCCVCCLTFIWNMTTGKKPISDVWGHKLRPPDLVLDEASCKCTFAFSDYLISVLSPANIWEKTRKLLSPGVVWQTFHLSNIIVWWTKDQGWEEEEEVDINIFVFKQVDCVTGVGVRYVPVGVRQQPVRRG